MSDNPSTDPERDAESDSSEEIAQPGQDPTATEHPTGERQAAENAENESPA